MNGYIDVYYYKDFLISELDNYKRNNILKKIYFLVYSYLRNSIIVDNEIYEIEYFDDGNIEEDGLKNIYFRIKNKEKINKDKFIIAINEFFKKDTISMNIENNILNINFSHVDLKYIL